MKIVVDTSTISGYLNAPTSKSYTHRAITMGALSNKCIVKNPLISADTLATVEACEKLGAAIINIDGNLHISGIQGRLQIPDDVIDVKNSGTTLRIMTALCALIEGTSILTGDKSIRTRPNKPLIDALRQLHADVFSTRNNGCAPLVVKGKLKGDNISIDGSVSSQFISAMLIACPLATNNTVLTIEGMLKSRPYIDITIGMLKEAGINIDIERKPCLKFIIPANQYYDLKEYNIPGDFSSASYLLAAAAMGRSQIVVKNLFPSQQGDALIIDVIKKMGAHVDWDKEKGNVTVQGKTLKGIIFDAGNTPDLVPTIAVLGAVAQGVTQIINAKHVRYKETDRLHAMAVELSKMGILVHEETDSLTITGGKLKRADLHGWHDHRIVMALTLAAMIAGNTTIDTVESVAISYPHFIDDMILKGAKIEKISI